MKNHILFITYLIIAFSTFSCSSKADMSMATYNIGLKESKKITLPIDENTYYFSRSIHQFEENDKEFLHFENTEKNQYNRSNFFFLST